MASRELDEERIFHIARRINNASALTDYLDQICAGDMALKERVVALIKVHQDSEFLSSNNRVLPTVDSPSVTESVGQDIGRFKLLQQIGAGGFGVVYMAEQQRPIRRKVALKIIKPGMDTQVVIARFEAERQALAMMDHPNIARVLDAGTTESGRPYFVMELVKGIPVTEYCDKNQLTAAGRLRLFMDICEAVQHAHQKGIIHRDLKPSNILVTLHDGHPVIKVIDFGVAKAINQRLTEKTLFTAYGQMVGTPQYMSPEQAEMSGLDVDTRSDIYSLGVVLYELLTGTTPLESDRLRSAGFVEIQRLITEQEPPRPSHRISSSGEELTVIAKHRSISPDRLPTLLRGDLDWVVMKAIEKDRSRRYETPNDLCRDVSNYLNDIPVEARSPSAIYRLQKYARRNRVFLLVCGTTLFSLLVTACVSTWMLFEYEKQNEELVSSRIKTETTLGFVRDYTMLLAMSGDDDDLEKAIHISSIVDASSKWQHLLRGRCAMHAGQLEVAISFFEKAVAENPGDLDCEALLLTARIWTGQSDGIGEKLRSFRGAMESREALSFEEMLFGGEVLLTDSDYGSELLNSALELRGSELAHLIRGLTLARYAMETLEADQLQTALNDVQLTLEKSSNSSFVIAHSLYVLTVAMQLRRNLDQGEWNSLRLEAEDLVAKLKSLRPDPYSLLVQAWYLDNFSDDTAQVNSAWQAVLRGESVGWHKAHAASIYILGTLEDESIERFAEEETLEQIGLIGALFHNDRMEEARDIYQRIPQDSKTLNFQFGSRLDALLVIGPADAVSGEAMNLLSTKGLTFTTEFDRELTRFLAGKIELEEVIEHCHDNSERTMAYFAAARLRIHEGEWKEAQQYLENCVRLGVVHISDYYWAKAYLKKYSEQFER